MPNHLAGGPTDERIPGSVLGRSMVVHDLPMVARRVRGTRVPDRVGAVGLQRDRRGLRDRVAGGAREANKLPEPIFTPASKAELGDHDENITYEQVVSLVGADLASDLRAATLDVYGRGADLAASRGIILADTKFEFGQAPDGSLVLADGS